MAISLRKTKVGLIKGQHGSIELFKMLSQIRYNKMRGERVPNSTVVIDYEETFSSAVR